MKWRGTWCHVYTFLSSHVSEGGIGCGSMEPLIFSFQLQRYLNNEIVYLVDIFPFHFTLLQTTQHYVSKHT